jgi:tetrahydromethanopterin S-methyltransferase subunit D
LSATIAAADLAIWKQFPNAVFALYNVGTTTGTFELPTNSSYSGEGEK